MNSNRLVLLICLTTALVSSASAANRKVPQQYPTIQAGVNAANPGDTVVVSAGIYVEDVTLNSAPFVNVRGKGKVFIHPSSGNGFTVEYGTSNEIENLRIVGGYFLIDDSSDVTVRKCRASGGAYGFRVRDSTAVRLEKNRTKNTASAAFSTSNSNDCKFVGNRSIQDPGVSGWTISGAGMTIRDNRIEGGQFGLYTSCNTALVADNRVEDVTAYGIYVYGHYGTFADNVIRDCENGIRTYTATYTNLFRNKIVGASQYGIDEIDSWGTYALDNDIRKAMSVGIHTSGDECTYRNNDIRKGGSFGFYVLGDLCYFRDNYARAQTGGLDLYESSQADNNTYIDNDVVTTNI